MFRRAGTAGLASCGSGTAGLANHGTKDDIEVLLVHPGGPFFRNKDVGFWSIPKGEAGEGEDLLTRAKIEFEEELGLAPGTAGLANYGKGTAGLANYGKGTAGLANYGTSPNFTPIGSVKQKGGKTVHAWAFEGNLPDGFEPVSNSFEMEWPPRSGKTQSFPEIDQAVFFPLAEARLKINEAQAAFLDRLMQSLV